MRTWGFRVYFTHRRHEYTEWQFPTKRDAYRFAIDLITEDPTVWRIQVIDGAHREPDFVLDERRAA